ncbi:MAG: DUF3574 domain-containing protein [Caulobacteraceae bacterium]
MRASLAARIALLALAGSALGGCATARRPLVCEAGQSRATTAEMVFGRDIGGGLGVSDADWRAFLDQEITPRFPEGLSVIDVQGQWRGADGTIVREPSKILFLVLDGGPDDPAKITHIRDAYKARFRQESVLLVTRPACVAF